MLALVLIGFQPASAGTFLTNAPMNIARRAHSATLLLDGKVLVAAGEGTNGGYLPNAERFDPATGVWLATGALTNQRAFHTATLLPNGKVLVAGGVHLESAELYDPVSGTWTKTGSMLTARFQHTATLLSNGKVLVAGGNDQFDNSTAMAELYDPATGVWTGTGAMNGARWRHSATLLPDGKVLVAGGGALISGFNFSVLSSTETYDPVTETWTTNAPLSTARFDQTSTLLANGKALLTGGFDNANSLSSTEIFDPGTGVWTGGGALNARRDIPQTTLLPDGTLLITGGLDGSTYLSSAEIYNPVTGNWSNQGAMSAGRWQHTATLLGNGKVLLAGGYDGAQLASTELYDSGGGSATNGRVQVTITPAGAVAAGAQWRVDGGPLQISGAVVTNLSGGNHVVSFTMIPGWITPSDQILTVVSAAALTNQVSGTYTLFPGALQVTLNPPGAVTDGAEWQVDGGAYHASGAVQTNLSVGPHTVAFKSIAGWFAPGNKTVMIATAATTNLAATYSLTSGALQVTLTPSGAVSAGARWRVDGGALQVSGDIVAGLSSGDHILTFNTVAGWISPSNQVVTLSANATNSVVGDYTSGAGALSVTLIPGGAVSAGARWQVDGGALRTSGTVVSGLAVNDHTVAFSPVAGWITPSNQTVAVGADVTNTAVGTYVLGELVKPTLSITAPKSGQRWSNAVFTVTGIAKDNVKVAAVFYQLNNTAWAGATLSNLTNWSAANLVLAPGTNTILAYAVDTSNNTSTTNTVKFIYVLSDRLGLTLNGRGTVSPNYSNALLEIGKNYSMTATAAKGFKFTDWSGSLATTAAKLVFNMQSNLSFTANFLDVTRPVNIVLTPRANQRWSNQLFTVTGKAGDNVRVSNVWYQLNNTGWSNAVTGNSFTNWSAPNLVLTPGTNILQSYAADLAGNRSLTNTIKFIYVLSDRLIVQFNGGRGTLSPNYSNAVLEIGKNYSTTARAAAGFRFLNWTGSLTTSSAKLTFNMQSNLSFTANFLDITRPVNVITVPKVNQKWSNAVFTANGKATDNVGVSNVWYQLDGTGWSLASLAVNRTDWSTVNLALLSGSNQIQAFAVDAVGNASLTNKVNFTYTVLPVADWAPDSLNGLLAQVTMADSNATENIGFDITTFAQTGVDTNSENFGVGNYLYNKTGTNTAQLGLTFTAPANVTNNETQVSVVFTNHYSGYFTNDGGGETGGISFVIATNFLPASLAGKTLVAIDGSSGQTNTIKLVNGVGFTKSPGGSSGTYTLMRFSPVSGLLAFTFTNTADLGRTASVQTTFTNKTSGRYFLTSFDNLGGVQETGAGKFIVK